tara:strand:+ start:151 stop:894 length:744 start_codon:yes stop_codon:yes gene_type:complete
MRIIAKLDGKPPNIVKPIHFEGLKKIGSPESLALKYYEDGADEILYIDIVASLYNREPIFKEVELIANNIFVPLAVGGGINSIEKISKMFHCGADKISLNTFPLQYDASIIDKAARKFGSQAILISIEAKKHDDWWECYSDCGREPSGINVLDWAREIEDRGAGEIVIQSVDKDGKRSGFDVELIKSIKEQVKIPIIAASGAGSVDDILSLVKIAKPDAVAISSMLHYELASIKEIKDALKANNILQ